MFFIFIDFRRFIFTKRGRMRDDELLLLSSCVFGFIIDHVLSTLQGIKLLKLHKEYVVFG